jgi:NifB/MoaA-like Fe-S oxidoreductase
LIDRLQAWQSEYHARFGSNWVYASDEWYLLADRDPPPAHDYEGFPQIENGIGLVRQLVDDWAAAARRRIQPAADRPITLVCGTLIAPQLSRLAADLAGRIEQPVQVLAVRNKFFGERVTVSGLLTGEDVRNELQSAQPSGTVFLPRAMFDAEGKLTLDGLTPADLQTGLGARLGIAGRLSEVIEQLVPEVRKRRKGP